MIPNVYQQNVYTHIDKCVEGTKQNLNVDAVAGSGKTSTIVSALDRLPKCRVLFCAFNRHIADTLAKRAPYFVEACTLNSFGFSILRDHSYYKVKATKTIDILWFDIFKKLNRKKYMRIRKDVARVVGLLKANMVITPSGQEIDAIVDSQGIILSNQDADFAEIVINTFKLCANAQKKVIDFDDQLYFPYIMQLPVPQFDYVFVDEAQDLNLIQMWLIEQAAEKGVIVTVGDTHQAIYGFRGAQTDAMSIIAEQFNATTLPLSICYRCAKSIVAEAQQIVPQIEHAPGAEDGIVDTIGFDEYDQKLIDGDWVLCRTTAPLVKEALRLIRRKQKAIVRGRDIGESLYPLIEHADNLEAYEDRMCKHFQNKEAQLVAILDRIETFRVLLEAYGREDIKNGIREVFAESTLGVTYCTVHRAKGLETDRVFLICPELMPHPRCTVPWQQEQEQNLKYIAITRAKKEFFYVEGVKNAVHD